MKSMVEKTHERGFTSKGGKKLMGTGFTHGFPFRGCSGDGVPRRRYVAEDDPPVVRGGKFQRRGSGNCRRGRVFGDAVFLCVPCGGGPDRVQPADGDHDSALRVRGLAGWLTD